MLTKTRVLRLIVAVAILLAAITLPPKQEPAKTFGERCLEVPCILAKDGSPWLKTNEGEFEIISTLFVDVGKKTQIKIVAGGPKNPIVLEIGTLTAIETATWSMIVFYQTGVAKFGCIGDRTMDKDDFLKLLTLQEADLSPSLCKIPPKAPLQEA